MNRETLESEIDRLAPWFHCVDVGHGVKTKRASVAGEPADHPIGTWQEVRKCLPADLTGQSVLDVGCNGGFYSVEAKRRGAERVLAVDVFRLHVRQTRFVSRALGLDIDARRASVYDLSASRFGRFDVTLALGLIYHLKHLVLGLEKLWQVTRHTLILETAIYPPRHLPRPLRHPVVGRDKEIHALGYVGNSPESTESLYNWFLPGTGALVALLENVGFHSVEVASVSATRAVLVCRRPPEYADSRQPDRLAARIAPVRLELRAGPEEELRLTVGVENTGQRLWRMQGEGAKRTGAVRLGAHLFAADEEELDWNYARADLPGDMAPGEIATLELPLLAPREPGLYFIELDMVSEEVTWFEDVGSPIERLRLTVE